MKKLFLFISLIFSIFISSCGGGEFNPPPRNAKKFEQNNPSTLVEENNSKENPTLVDKDFNTQEYQNQDSSLVITTVEVQKIPESVSYDYYYPGSKITFYFNPQSMAITLYEKNSWFRDYEFSGNWSKTHENGTDIFKNKLTDGTLISITVKNNQIYGILIGNENFPISKKEVTPDKVNTRVKSGRLKLLENNEVIVEKGQNLNYIIDLYNKENGTDYTLDQVRAMNNLKSTVITPDMVIVFK
jgi:hypothetical protein